MIICTCLIDPIKLFNAPPINGDINNVKTIVDLYAGLTASETETRLSAKLPKLSRGGIFTVKILDDSDKSTKYSSDMKNYWMSLNVSTNLSC